MVMKDGVVTYFKLGSLFMHPFPTCFTRITKLFKQGWYSYRSNKFIPHGRCDMLLDNSSIEWCIVQNV